MWCVKKEIKREFYSETRLPQEEKSQQILHPGGTRKIKNENPKSREWEK